MLLNKVLKICFKNQGATLTSKLKNAPHKIGFYVSFYGYEKILNITDTKAIKETLKAYKKLSKRINAYIGLWIEEDKIYFDLSQYIYTESAAYSVAVAERQKAFYNILENKCVYL